MAFKRMRIVLALATALLAGCFAPGPQVTARNWRPLGPDGLTLGQLLAVSPCVKNVTWESFAGVRGQTVVRVTAEYDPVRAATGCPPLGPGLTLAVRAFLVLDLAVTPAGAVTFLAAKAQAYNADGFYEEYWLDIGVVADLTARALPLPCADLGVPSYLR